MRTTEQIAAEAIKNRGDLITFKRVDYQTMLYAIEIGRTEAIAELMLRDSKAKIPVYILTTPFNKWKQEIAQAERMILLPGWNNTKAVRERNAYAKELKKERVPFHLSKTEA
ncbi:MAG: hypothetical protein JU82_09235 [Sulfuricurvum sp. MLSB]|uniref:hypothetical protein n=1 Tax=Sulfuricurvum sp. MLSB TaxID=1537917 RepID=UPI000503A603|nr:hypothetical protein [Sulfuricurvum sp. MLSB]KFN38960.1 MAG: hypothetical protein JU82_09235 [Sulfuricurvum sp. MLSB]